MALVKYGGGVASMSGKQGGAVHSRGRTGAIIKDWTKPCNPANAKQSQRRASFAGQTAAWGLLTDAQRSAWNAFAASMTRLNRQGDSYVPTGRQMYIELNANLNLIGQVSITAPPIGSVPPTIPSALTLTVTEAANVLATMLVAGGATDATILVYVKAAPPQMTGRANVQRQFRSIGSFTAGASVNIKSAYQTQFGAVMPLGGNVQVSVSFINKTTGLASPELVVLGTATV